MDLYWLKNWLHLIVRNNGPRLISWNKLQISRWNGRPSILGTMRFWFIRCLELWIWQFGHCWANAFVTEHGLCEDSLPLSESSIPCIVEYQQSNVSCHDEVCIKKKRQWKNEKAMWWYKGVELLWIFKLMAKLAVLDLIAQVLYRHEDHNSGFKLKLGYCTQKEATEEKDYMS
jgi:hypothetical protein